LPGFQLIWLLSEYTLPYSYLPKTGIKVYEMLEKVLVIEPVIRWASIANVILNAKVHSFKVSVQLEDLHIMLTPRVTLKPLVPSFPCFANLCVSLMEKPHIDFRLKLLGGDIMAIPGLYRYIQDQISNQISVLYHWPKVIHIPILDGVSGATKKPVGILHVKVIRALNLLKMDLLGKSDPYVKMRLSGERLPSKKTSVKMSNLNPEWNEHFRFIVKDPDTQVLELHMFDWEKVSCCMQTSSFFSTSDTLNSPHFAVKQMFFLICMSRRDTN